jgi:methylmalonyl-CoA/ethylmalonyl-CoA epimerase
MIKRIDHIAIVVDDMDGGLAFWQDTLGLPLTDRQSVPEQESNIAFLPAGQSEVELVTPTTTTSGIARFLSKRGPGIHHICFEVDDIAATLASFKARDVRLIDETPRRSTDGKQYAFIHPESTGGVLIELYELPVAPPAA